MILNFLSKFIRKLPKDFGDLSMGTRISVEGIPCMVESRVVYRGEHEYLVEYGISKHKEYTHIIWNGIEPQSSRAVIGHMEYSEISTENNVPALDKNSIVDIVSKVIRYEGKEFRYYDDRVVKCETNDTSRMVTFVRFFHLDYEIRFDLWHDENKDGKTTVSISVPLNWENTNLIQRM